MNDNSDFDQLDALLAQPALLADRGFSERVAQRLRRFASVRRNIFLITGLCWLALVFIAASPEALYAAFSTLVLSLDVASIYSSLSSQIQSLGGITQQLPYTTVAATVLSLAAVASIAIRA